MARTRRLQPAARHALKEDRFVESTVEAVYWGRRHLPTLIGAAAGSILLAVVVGIVWRGRAAAMVASWENLFQAETSEAVATAVAEAPRAPVRSWLLLEQANRLLDDKKYEESVRVYDETLESHPISQVVVQAKIGLAHALIALGKWKEAAQQLSDSALLDSYYRPEAAWLQAFCYEKLGDRQAAEAAYSSLRSDFPETVWADLAEHRLAQINVGVEPAKDEQSG